MDSKVCILLPRIGVYPALGVMLADVFRDLGWRPVVRHRAGPDLLDHDLLLLAGLCRYVDGLPDLLRKRQGNVPVTVLWQLEPLPPPELSELGEKIGLRVAACDWGRIPPTAGRVVSCLIPFRTQLMRLARRWLARPYSRQVVRQPDHEGWKQYDAENYYSAMADWLWIKHAHANGWLDYCFASVQPRVRFLHSRGITAEMIPFGYHPDWGRDLQVRRDIDVLFLGRMGRGQRRSVLSRLQEQLTQRGRTLTLVQKAHGAGRDALLSRTRIMLNLLRAPHDLAGMRVMMGMACGALVVSEHCDDTGAFRPDQHFVMAQLDKLAEVIGFHLAHEEMRRKIAREGHRFVTQELTLANMIRKMLQVIASGPYNNANLPSRPRALPEATPSAMAPKTGASPD